MTTGEKIRVARKAAGLKQRELAERLHVSEANISQYENGNRNPKLKTLRKIAAALGVRDYDLMDDSDRRGPGEPQLRDLFAAENWHRWVDRDLNPIFQSREEFEEWSKDFDPEDPPLLTDYFIAGDDLKDGIKKEPAPESGLADEEDQLVEYYREMNEVGQKKLLDYADDLVSSGKYEKKSSHSAG